MSLSYYLNTVNGASFLSWPLKKFYINSSHNSYLDAYQIGGNSTSVNTKNAIIAGARCVELDVHRLGALANSANIRLPNTTPIVVHGNGSVVDVSYSQLQDHFQVIRDYAWNGTDDPMFIGLEIFDADDTVMIQKLADLIRQFFGSRLYAGTMDKFTPQTYLPNVPFGELRNKVAIIINYYGMNVGAPVPGQSYNLGIDNRNKYLFPVVHATNGEPDNGWFTSGQLIKGINSSDSAIVNAADKMFNVYPDNQITSSNYRPVRYWGKKYSMTSLNFATSGWNLTANQRFFANANIVPKGAYVKRSTGQLIPVTDWFGFDLHDNAVFTAPSNADSIVILPNTAYTNDCFWNCKTYRLVMQNDGNLVMYNKTTPTWASGTSGNVGAYLKVQNDNNLVIVRRSDARVLWASNTYKQTDIGGGAVFDASGTKGALEVYHADGTRLARFA